MTENPEYSCQLELFSQYMEHARHLENYLLLFTQVFLVITGALWGYALLGESHSGTRSLVAGLEFVVFAFHLVYAVAGVLFVIRCSTNYRKNWEKARQVLLDSSFGDYAVYVYPEGPDGKMHDGRQLSTSWTMLFTAKAFFVLLYIGAVGVDTFYLGSLFRRGDVLFLTIVALTAMVLVLTLVVWAYAVCSQEVTVRVEKKPSPGSDRIQR